MDGTSYSGFCPAKTTDQCFVDQDISISRQVDCQDINIQMLNMKNDSLVVTIDNVLSNDTCKSIISFCEREHPLTVIDKLTVELKPKSEYVIEDRTFATELYSSVLESPIKDFLEDNSVKRQPLGFDVTKGDWLVQGIDDTFQIFKVQPNDKSIVLPQRDAQRCHNNDKRSLFSLLIFLNEDFEDGNTEFYFPINENSERCVGKDMTVLNEIEAANGLEKGYDSFSVSGCQGKAILYSHDVLYQAYTVRNGCKWLLKANVMLKRNMNQYHLVVSDTERNDYLKCVAYFERGQSLEAKGLYKEANDIYEKALSIRYSHPSNQSEACGVPGYSPNSNQYVLPETVWLLVFDFISGKDIENVVKAFNYLYSAKKSFEMKRYRTDLNSSNNALYMPSLTDCSGTISCFTFPDVFFFHSNEEACVRVAAMYASCMIQRRDASASQMPEKKNTSLVVYNAETQSASPITLQSILKDVFLNRDLFGAVYSISDGLDLESNFTDVFFKSVDRSFMTMRHKSQFVGIPLAQKMKLDINWCNVTDEEIATIVKKRMGEDRRLKEIDMKGVKDGKLMDVNSPLKSYDNKCRVYSDIDNAHRNTKAVCGENSECTNKEEIGINKGKANNDKSNKSNAEWQLIDKTDTVHRDLVSLSEIGDGTQGKNDAAANANDRHEFHVESITDGNSVRNDCSDKVGGAEMTCDKDRENSGDYGVDNIVDDLSNNVCKMEGDEINDNVVDCDSENDDISEEDMTWEKPFKPYVLKMIEQNLGPNYEVCHDFVLRDFEGWDDSLACFPLALKDIFRYRKWEALFGKYHLNNNNRRSEWMDEKEWLRHYLLFENVFLYYLSKAPYFNDVYGDGEYHEPEKSTPQQLYIKLLIDVCNMQPAMTYTSISCMKNVVCVPKSSFCICAPPFTGAKRDRFEVIEKQTNEFFNLLVFDFNSHKLHVTKESDLTEKTISKFTERDCLFYNSIFSVLCKKKLEGLSNHFHYTVYTMPLFKDPPSKTYHERFPFVQDFNAYGDCGCVGAEFEVKQCYNVEDFCAIDHIHVIGATKSDTNEVVVWTAIGGLAAL